MYVDLYIKHDIYYDTKYKTSKSHSNHNKIQNYLH